MATIGVPPHRTAVISGIGCSSRLPYYCNTYGFHTIHGRAAAIATGFKVANPDMTVWQSERRRRRTRHRRQSFHPLPAPQCRHQHSAAQQQNIRSDQRTVLSHLSPWIREQIITLRHHRRSFCSCRTRLRRTKPPSLHAVSMSNSRSHRRPWPQPHAIAVLPWWKCCRIA